jgi:hypothetical protein
MNDASMTKLVVQLIFIVLLWTLLLQSYCGVKDLNVRVAVLESHAQAAKVAAPLNALE